METAAEAAATTTFLERVTTLKRLPLQYLCSLQKLVDYQFWKLQLIQAEL